jgi:hypothetical protein
MVRRAHRRPRFQCQCHQGSGCSLAFSALGRGASSLALPLFALALLALALLALALLPLALLSLSLKACFVSLNLNLPKLGDFLPSGGAAPSAPSPILVSECKGLLAPQIPATGLVIIGFPTRGAPHFATSRRSRGSILSDVDHVGGGKSQTEESKEEKMLHFEDTGLG